MKRCWTILFFIILLAIGAGQAFADSIPLTGVRTSGSGLTGSGDYASGVSLSWSITQNGSLYTFTYTFTHATPATSHFILQITDGKLLSDFTRVPTATGGNFSSDSPKIWGPQPSNPGIPGSFYGIKFEGTSGTTTVISFTTLLPPVWGSFYAKGGSDSGVWNSGFISTATSRPGLGVTDFTGWIAVPDGGTHQVPEPSSLLLLAIGLGAVSLASARYRRR